MRPEIGFMQVPATTIEVFSLWIVTMNRCIRPRTRALAPCLAPYLVPFLAPGFARFFTPLLLTGLWAATPAWAQEPVPWLNQGQMPVIGARQFPASAQRGVFEVGSSPEVVINGKPERLSPGHRIRGSNNQLVMSGQLSGLKVTVNYLRDTLGNIHEVWILNALEALEDRPGSGPLRNYVFESQIDPAKK
jgi:hypothetical protein